MSKIPYNKDRSGKLISRGGPRDIQQRQMIDRQQDMLRKVSSDNDSTGVRPHIVVSSAPNHAAELDASQFLPLEEVRRKLEEAVETVRKEERKRYESGLNSLNDQLKDIRQNIIIYR